MTPPTFPGINVRSLHPPERYTLIELDTMMCVAWWLAQRDRGVFWFVEEPGG